ncbi:signal peptidase II [Mycoplasmopsis ciconiae]|uniref:Signal peptidase II n=1 Tax=Mycoplasmopsis ciconiae TaxID=561067 RepID=A0ABU7MLL8_9BACT|nr:signal peptidase II [Mycoplasmopsis ciconiae]
MNKNTFFQKIKDFTIKSKQKIKEYSLKNAHAFKEYTKTNKKRIIISYIILISVVTILLLVDQLTKTFIFKHVDVHNLVDGKGLAPDGSGQYIYPETIYPSQDKWLDYIIIGFRFIWHKGVTFLPRGINLNIIQVLSILIIVFIVFATYFAEWRFVVFMAFICAGAAGNMIDRFLFDNHVKDLLYVPFLEKRGTFNFADTWVIIGTIGTLATILVDLIIDFFKRLKNKKNENETKID